jgi:hypothetical protein
MSRLGRNLRGNTKKVPTLTQQVIAILRLFGSDAHIYIPGVGQLNGLTAGNYLDSAGTTGATVDNPVGLVLDAAGGLGPELVTNGGFDTSAGWALVNGAAVSGGQLSLPAGDATAIFAGVSCTSGLTYKFEFDYVSGSGTQFINIQAGSAIFGVITATTPRRYAGFIRAGATDNIKIWQDGGVAGSAVIDNISVREVTGIPASQATTGSKPILRRGLVNLLTWSGDYTQGAQWIQGGLSVAKNAIGISGGSNTACTVTIAAPAHALYTAGAAIAVTPLTAYTFAFYAKRGTASELKYSVKNVTVGGDIIPVTSYYAQTNSTDFSLIVVNFTAPAGCTRLNIFPLRDSVATGTVILDAALIAQGTYTAAQIIAAGGIPLTTTAPASSSQGPSYWQFDGNNSLALSSVPFQMADDHCVVAGFSATNLAGYPIVVAGAQGSGPSAVCLLYAESDGKVVIRWVDDANQAVYATSPIGLVSSGKMAVAVGRKVGATVSTRFNGIPGGVGLAPTGPCTVVNSYFGGAFSGPIYLVIAIKGTVTNEQLIKLEKFVALMSGVTL